MPRYRVLAIASHPVQYMSPIFRRMAKDHRFDLRVAYCSLRGAEPGVDPEFEATVQWDVPLLDGYTWTHVPNRGSGADSFWGLRNPGLRALVRDGRFHAVLCYVSYRRASFWIAYRAARSCGVAFLFGTDAASLAPRDGRSWKAAAKNYFWPFLFRLADQVIVPSTATAEMMSSLGIPDEKVTLTPFVVDNDWWNAQAARTDRNATRASWGVSENDLAVLYCAKLQSWKRPADLLQAFAAANVPHAHLVFAGEGPQRAQLEAEANSLEICARVHFLGFANQSLLPAVYSAADLFVLPSGYDPCPAVVCEAMVCGLPVLLSDAIRGRFDLVQPGLTGDIFPCGNVHELSCRLTAMLGDRTALRTLGRNARARMATWSPAENLDGTAQAIKKALLHRRRPGTAASAIQEQSDPSAGRRES